MASLQTPKYQLSVEFKGTLPNDKSRFVTQIVDVVLDEKLQYIAGHPLNTTKVFGMAVPLNQNEISKRLTFKPETKNSYSGRPDKITFSVWNSTTNKWDDKATKDIEENDQVSVFEKARVAASASYKDTKLKAQNAYRAYTNDERGQFEYKIPDKHYVKPDENSWPADQWVLLENIRVPFTMDIDKFTVPITTAASVHKESFSISFTGFVKVGNRLVESIYITGCSMIGLKDASALAKAELKTCKASTNCILLETKMF